MLPPCLRLNCRVHPKGTYTRLRGPRVDAAVWHGVEGRTFAIAGADPIYGHQQLQPTCRPAI
jgi:hypothetical protein